MLQVKHLVKRYEAKGETVTALNDVSVDFPERGMVFLLGKSGSGKSTLLNVSGGLDVPDEGEVIVNGKSSKDFTKSDFDSYRNTYLGFIFQEYNILTELTVEENVALALELQGKPKDKEKVEEILAKVDLAGYGDRRPNTLSGGQRQRVAIARALVKDPEIIMADEPTGALDSKTGAQVFDTLKRLSANKLVVVVSHDREFAEVYADRIIELKDGNIVSDMTRNGGGGPVERANLFSVSEKKMALLSGADLSEEDERKLLAFVRSHKGGLVISAEEGDLASVHTSADPASQATFVETKPAEVPVPAEDCHFIRSRFPFRYALKMGFSGLKAKPVRLIFTTLLATVAFLVFGVFSTVITFTTAQSGAATLADSSYQAAILEKCGLLNVKLPTASGWSNVAIGTDADGRSHFSEEEAAAVRKAHPGMNFVPAYTLEIADLDYTGELPSYITSETFFGHTTRFSAFADASYLGEIKQFTVHGRLPANAGECAVSALAWEAYHTYGYGYSNPVPIETYEDLLGKTIELTHNWQLLTAEEDDKRAIPLTIVGVVETGENFSKFAPLREERDPERYSIDVWHALESELEDVYLHSMSSLLWVGEGFRDRYMPANLAQYYRQNVSTQVNNLIRVYGAEAEITSDFLLTDEEGNLVAERYLYNGNFPINLYTVDTAAEAEGSYIEYLYAPLTGDRSAKSTALFGYDRVIQTAGYYYTVPYDFMVSVRESRTAFGQIFTVLGVVAVGLAVFAALLLFNFISASIGAKKKDIGILRAVGARGIDVYKIFMVEGVVITLACFAIGSILSFVACVVVNQILMSAGLLSFKIFLFGGLNTLIVFAVAFVTAAVSTSVPVALTVRKHPVEAIRSV